MQSLMVQPRVYAGQLKVYISPLLRKYFKNYIPSLRGLTSEPFKDHFEGQLASPMILNLQLSLWAKGRNSYGTLHITLLRHLITWRHIISFILSLSGIIYNSQSLPQKWSTYIITFTAKYLPLLRQLVQRRRTFGM